MVRDDSRKWIEDTNIVTGVRRDPGSLKRIRWERIIDIDDISLSFSTPQPLPFILKHVGFDFGFELAEGRYDLV